MAVLSYKGTKDKLFAGIPSPSSTVKDRYNRIEVTIRLIYLKEILSYWDTRVLDFPYKMSATEGAILRCPICGIYTYFTM